MQYLGNVPCYADASGNVVTDPEAVAALQHGGGGEVGRFRPFAFLSPREQRLAHIEGEIAQREAELGRKQSRWGIAPPTPAEEVSHSPGAPRTLDAAKRAGVVNQNSWNGLGSVSVALSNVNTLTSTINRIGWVKGLVLDSDSPSNILVTALTIAGIPVQIGSGGAPLSLFKSDSTRFSEEFSSRLVAFGQQVQVGLQNLDPASAHTVSGVVVMDEAAPQAFSRLMETLILSSLVG